MLWQWPPALWREPCFTICLSYPFSIRAPLDLVEASPPIQKIIQGKQKNLWFLHTFWCSKGHRNSQDEHTQWWYTNPRAIQLSRSTVKLLAVLLGEPRTCGKSARSLILGCSIYNCLPHCFPLHFSPIFPYFTPCQVYIYELELE